MDRDLAGRESILNVILDVHMRNTGALETCKEDQLRDLKILKTRYFNWEPSVGCGGKYEKFDDAVKDLLLEVLSESYKEEDECNIYCDEEESFEEDKENENPTKRSGFACPRCGSTIKNLYNGVDCPNPKCDYWYCY